MFDCLLQNAKDNKRFIFIDIKLALGKNPPAPPISQLRHAHHRLLAEEYLFCWWKSMKTAV